MPKIVFYVEWQGERAAGIMPGYEQVTINFLYGTLDSDIEYWRGVVQDYFDGATVMTEEESKAIAVMTEEGCKSDTCLCGALLLPDGQCSVKGCVCAY